FNPDGTRGVLAKALDTNENSLRSDLFLFSETQSRVITSINDENWRKIKEIAGDYSIPVLLIGVVTDDDRFCIENSVDMRISEVHDAWSGGFKRSLSITEGQKING
ncbi:MAG: hypothetical protein OXF23_02050, partial [Candidatus Dadabacteria bacterium]|nr:hypothetical protein [Candidatus Dadabacteria bacterium]